MRTIRLFLPAFIAVIATLGGCSPLHRSVPEADLLRADKHIIVTGIDVPAIKGVNGCGAQALAAMIAFADAEVAADELASELPWRKDGATPVDLLLEARRRGFDATISRGSIESLKHHVINGEPALVMLDAGLEVRSLLFRYPTPKVMHWAVVSGLARDDSQVLIAMEKRRHAIASNDDFIRRWAKSDYCMILVQSPNRH